MIITTKLFGDVEVRDDDVVHFPEGLVGFDDAKEFVIVEAEELKPLTWLVCVQDPDLVFPLAEPGFFTDRYELDLTREDRALLDVETVDDVESYVIVTLADEENPLCANLRGLLLINVHSRVGKQLVFCDERFDFRQPALASCSGALAK